MKLDKLTDNQYNAYHELLAWYPIPSHAITRIGKHYMRIYFDVPAKGRVSFLSCTFRYDIRLFKDGRVTRHCRILGDRN
jgi:hypothetical protein